MSIELSKKDREKLRQVEEEMRERDLEDALGSPSPNAGLLALLAKHEYDRTRLENAEQRVAELKDDVDKALKQARKVDDLFRRLDKLTRKE